MRPNAKVVLMRMVARTALVFRLVVLRRCRVLVVAPMTVAFAGTVRCCTQGFCREMFLIAGVCPRSGAAAHQVLSNEHDKHH